MVPVERLPRRDLTFTASASTPKLYHYLNHYVLFGSGYKGECLGLLQSLVPS